MLRPDFVPLDFKAFDLRVPLHGLISSNSDSGSGSGSGASSPPSAVARRPDDAGPSAAAASTATIASTTSSAESTVTRSLPLNHIVYVLTGVMQVLLVQYLHYEGAADRRSLLTVTATYVGMVLAFFAPKFSSLWGLATAPSASATADVPTLVSLPPRQHSYLVEQGWIMGISVLDLLGLSLCSAAVTLIGSSLYQVIYASIVVMIALFSVAVFRTVLSTGQWLSIGVVTMGLMLSISSVETGSSEEYWSFSSGIVLALLGTAVYAGVYIANERLLRFATLSPERICTMVGCYCCFLCTIYLFSYTLPNWQTLVTQSMNAHAADVGNVLGAYAMLVLASLVHNVSYFKLIGSAGSISTGILQSLRTVSMFVASSVFFCHIDTLQCITPAKTLSVAVVCIGLVIYVFTSRRSSLPSSLHSA